jgi:HEAT repeat protein
MRGWLLALLSLALLGGGALYLAPIWTLSGGGPDDRLRALGEIEERIESSDPPVEELDELDQLIHMALADPDRLVRFSAARALAAVANRRAVRALEIVSLRDDPDESYTGAASLRENPSPEAIAALVRLIAHTCVTGDPRIATCMEAQYGLRKRGSSVAVAQVRPFLDARDEHVRAAAINVLCDIDKSPEMRSRIALIGQSDPSSHVQVAAFCVESVDRRDRE